jgi:hypothetical protein
MREVLEYHGHDNRNERKQEKMAPTDYYHLLRGHITQTHDLINQRTIWLSISQSFFYGGYATVANAPKDAKAPVFAEQQEVLLWLLPVAALIACVAIYLGLIGRVVHLSALRKQFEKYVGENAEIADYPSIDATPLVRTLEKAAYLILPAVFVLAWIFILVRQTMGSN